MFYESDGSWIRAEIRSPLRSFELVFSSGLIGPATVVQMHKGATDDDMKPLLGIKHLDTLNLAYCYNISDTAIKQLMPIRTLRVLYLYRNNPKKHNNFIPSEYDLSAQPRVTDTSLVYLSEMKSLRELYLWDNDFSNQGVLVLSKLKLLHKLALRSDNVDERTIELLRQALPDTIIDGQLRGASQ